MKTDHAREVAQGQRFEFGKNWARFLRELDEKRITAAVQSLQDMLQTKDLTGLRFLDVGSGSGLFSLAARRLGATVFSFDYDPESVACTRELKRRFYPQDDLWTIESGSALDSAYLKSLGEYDVVYSWGVLHHTGDMWRALENAIVPCKPGGQVFIALYNDQGRASRIWTAIKKLYNAVPRPGKLMLVLGAGAYFVLQHLIASAMLFQKPFAKAARGPGRGMSWFRDLVDWVGGYPFEVARPEQVCEFFSARFFSLMRLTTTRRHGCNQFVFRRDH